MSEPTEPPAYQRVTVYLTQEQVQWLDELTGQAKIDRVPISASDVVRLGLDGLRGRREDVLRKQLIAHIHAEAELYPGRTKRGMPEAPRRAASRRS